MRDAQKFYRAASDRLKVLMNDPEYDINSNDLLNPTDKPVAEPFFYNTAECIQTALQQRPEIQQARLQVGRADIVITVAKNDLLPQLDLTLGMQTNGLDNSFDQAFISSVDPMNSLDFVAGIKFQFSLGYRGEEAALARRKNERKQAIENMVQAAQNVVQDLKTEMREVVSLYLSVQDRDEARLAVATEFEQRSNEYEQISPRRQPAKPFHPDRHAGPPGGVRAATGPGHHQL